MSFDAYLRIGLLTAILAGCSSTPLATTATDTPPLPAQEKVAESEVDMEPQRVYTRITCKKDKEIQILEIDSTPTQGCVLKHTKGKKRNKLRYSPNSRKPCQLQRDEILIGLKAKDFACDEPSPITSR